VTKKITAVTANGNKDQDQKNRLFPRPLPTGWVIIIIISVTEKKLSHGGHVHSGTEAARNRKIDCSKRLPRRPGLF